jgi:hypothetical protein
MEFRSKLEKSSLSTIDALREQIISGNESWSAHETTRKCALPV